jgi:hypothetical protein
MIMLASLVVGVGMFVQKMVMEKKTENIINKLKLAVAAYMSDYDNIAPPSHERLGETNDCVVGNGAGIQALCSYVFWSKNLSDMVNPDGTNKVARLLGKPDHYARPKDFRGKVVVMRTDAGFEREVDYVTDAWGTPLFYYVPGARGRNPGGFDLWSAGPDRQTSITVHDGSTNPYDYSVVVPKVLSGAGMVNAGGATGAVWEITGYSEGDIIPSGGDDAERNAMLDDLGNFKRVKDTGL